MKGKHFLLYEPACQSSITGLTWLLSLLLTGDKQDRIQKEKESLKVMGVQASLLKK